MAKLTEPLISMQCVSVVFSDHTHFGFISVKLNCPSLNNLKVLTFNTLCLIVEVCLVALTFPSIAIGTHRSTVR